MLTWVATASVVAALAWLLVHRLLVLLEVHLGLIDVARARVSCLLVVAALLVEGRRVAVALVVATARGDGLAGAGWSFVVVWCTAGPAASICRAHTLLARAHAGAA